MTEFKLNKCINWNRLDDPIDGQIWDKLIEQFWVPEAIPVSQDAAIWRQMTPEEKDVTGKVFTSLGCLDHLQGTVGAISLIDDSQTEHESAVYTNIAFMESIHARSYSSVFSTLMLTPEIDKYFEWAEQDEALNRKLDIVRKYYDGDDPLKKKVAAAMLEGFLFYSQFFWPYYLASRGKLTNVGTVVSLILRDEAVHAYYIGYKYQRQLEKFPERKEEMFNFTLDLLMELYENERQFVENIYDQVGLSEQVKHFLRYNANRALMNLGYDALFGPDQTVVAPEILSAISGKQQNHDFFSLKGSSYKVLSTDDISEEDWDF